MQENKTQPFDEAQMSRIQKFLNTCSDENTPRFFEVIVDGIKVISRTNNPSEFAGYKKHLDLNSKNLRVLVYHDGSDEFDEYNFTLKQENTNQNQLTGAADLDTRITERINAAKKEWDYDQLVKQKAQLEADLKEANDYIGTLEKGIDDFKNKKFQLGDVNLGEVASVVFEGILRRNKDKIAKLPGLEGLMGIFNDHSSQNQISQSTEKEPEVSVEKETDTSEEDKIYLAVAHWLKSSFSNEEIEQVNVILKILAQDKKLILTVLELLTQNQKKQ